MKRFTLIFCTLLIGFLLQAQSIPWDGKKDWIDIGAKVYIFTDTSNQLTINEVSASTFSDNFIAHQKNIINFGFSHEAHWLKFSIQNKSEEDLWLELQQAYLAYADLYYKDPNGRWEVLKGGFEVGLNEKPIRSHLQVYPLPKKGGTFYVRFISYAHPVPIRIWNATAYEANASNQKLIFGIYVGIMIFVILNNLLLFFSLRKIIYLHYAFLVLVYLGVAGFVMEGFALYLFPNISPLYWYLFIPTVAMVIATTYCMSFLQVKQYDPKMYPIARMAAFAFFGYAIMRHFIPLHIAVPLNMLISPFALLLQGVLGVRSIFKGNKFGYYYAFAYLIYFFMVILETVYMQTGRPLHIFELSFVSHGILIEVLLLAFALSKRFEWEKKTIEDAKTDAQNQLLEKIRENEKMTLVQNQRLKEIDKLKDQFLANTSHELKTPLHGIIGLSESLQTQTNDAHILQDLDLITSSGKRLAALVNDLLDFSKLQNFEILLQKKAVDLYTLVEVVLRIYYPLIENKEIKLINEIPKELPPVDADENRLQQILHNFLGNALKFTSKGTIQVFAKVEQGKIRIGVSDTGIGIPLEKQAIIFNEFQQADGSISRNYGGTGLGLSITRRLVQLHGSTIKLDSTPGKGSIFSFDLPISKEKRFEQPISTPFIAPNPINISSKKPILAIKNNNFGLKNIRILGIDDELINQKILQNHLGDKDFDLHFASSGEEGLTILENSPKFDLVLLDIMMPKMSGYEVCEKIRAKFLPSELPIIMVSAKNQTIDLVQGLALGANDYLTKPFSKDEFLARVKTQLDLHRIFEVAGKFVPIEFIRALGKNSFTEVGIGDFIEKEVTVLFSDIRKYTTLAETMTLEENYKFVQAFNARMGPIIQKHDGFVNQYLGDGIMAIFPNRIEDCLQSAIQMQKKLQAYNQKRRKNQRKPIKIGIGLHTGPLVMGIIGDKDRFDAATISDTVNATSRIETLTKYYQVSILISQQSRDQMVNPANFNLRYFGKVLVKGKKDPIGVYECFDGDPPNRIEKKLKTLAVFEEGLKYYQEKSFEAATCCFDQVLAINPDDFPAQLFRNKAEDNQRKGVPENWSSIEPLSKY